MNTRLTTLFEKRFEIPKANTLKKAMRSFSPTEKFMFWGFVMIFIGSALVMLLKVNNTFLVSIPDKGGELIEGVVGSPRFVNPLLAISDADKDASSLIYSGLLRATSAGELIPDLAEKYEVSPDGKTYTFTLRENARFHDGIRVTTDDIEFTIQKAQDPAIKSPRRANWDGVMMEKINEREFQFILEQPYAPFIENATIGILPKHIWKNATPDEFAFSEYNVLPIGSGPYKVKSVGRNSAGIPNKYELRSFNNYTLGEPYITSIILRFYPNQSELAEALESGDVESASGLSSEKIALFEEYGKRVEKAVLPRIFAVFFNQNQASIFTHKEVRLALDASVDKEKIVNEILHGYGTVIDSPIPPTKIEPISTGNASTTLKIEQARKILEDAGWKMNEENGIYEKKTKSENIQLSFSFATGDAPELKATAQLIKDDWTRIGADVSLEIFEIGDLNQNIIRPRKYDALLFGEIIGRDNDLYPFWHSSQRNDPGLNIALYVNSTADKLLEEARTTNDINKRNEAYKLFEEEIKADAPVVFLYSPSFLYVIPKKVEGVSIGQLTVSGDRFLDINKWFIEKNKVWKIFTD